MVRANKREACVKATKLFAKGMPAAEVARKVGVSPITARAWKDKVTTPVTTTSKTPVNVKSVILEEISKRRQELEVLEKVVSLLN